MTKCFLELGAKVAIVSRNKEKLDLAAQELREETKGDIFNYSLDVGDYEAVVQMREAVISK